MKKSNNNIKKIFRTLTFVVLVMLVAAFKLSATENERDSLKVEEKVSKEEMIMIDDLLASLEEVDVLESISDEAEPTVEVYSSTDKLLFSGTQKQWEVQVSTDLLAAKRKAELLFELNPNCS